MTESPLPITNPTSSLDYTKVLQNLDEQMAAIAATMTEGNTEKLELNQQIAEFEKAVRELKYKITGIDNDQFETKRTIRTLERERQSAERKLRVALENEALAEELKRLGTEYDKITMGAPWREWAKDYQITGAKTLAAANKGILADKMGLGKTLTCIAWADMLQAKRIVAFVPNDTMTNFKREIAKWSKRKAYILGGMPRASRHIVLETLKDIDEWVIVLNYEAWRKDFKSLDLINELRPDTVIADEAHIIKDRKSLAFRGVKTVVHANNQCNFCDSPNIVARDTYYGTKQITCENCGEQPQQIGDFSSVKYVLPMTGTPILNRPQDLFTLLNLIDPGKFHNEYRFLDDYCTRNPYTQKWQFSSGGLERLTASLSNKFIMRDRRSVGLELPPQSIVEYELALTEEDYPKQWATAKALNAYAQLILSDNTKADGSVALNVLYMIALITRKRQIMTWGGDIVFQDGDRVFKVDCDESIKLDRIIKYTNGDFDEWDGLIPDITNNGERDANGNWTGERVVVFSQFKMPLIELERRCKAANLDVVRYDGDTPQAIAEQVKLDVDRSYESGEPRKWQVILANYKKGGVGLNFTDITHTIILDEEWNPGKRDQAYGRTQRIGQTQDTTVHILRVAGSIDTWMETLIQSKSDMITGFESNMELNQALLEYLADENSL